MRTLSAADLQKYATMNIMNGFDKEPTDASCWNWALYGLRAVPIPQPSLFFGYVHRAPAPNQIRADAAAELNANANHLYDDFQVGRPLRQQLDAARIAYDATGDTTADRNHARDVVFDIAVRSAGFAISAAPTPYRICMFEPEDVVMFDHWWLEIAGAVVETVTGQKLYTYSDQYLSPLLNYPRDRYVNRGGPKHLDAARQARAHARYVTSLQDGQAHYLEMLAG